MSDTSHLTPGQVDALRRIDRGIFYRVPGGYACPGEPKVTLNMVIGLERQRLVRHGLHRGRFRIWLTGEGRRIVDTLNARTREVMAS